MDHGTLYSFYLGDFENFSEKVKAFSAYFRLILRGVVQHSLCIALQGLGRILQLEWEAFLEESAVVCTIFQDAVLSTSW